VVTSSRHYASVLELKFTSGLCWSKELKRAPDNVGRVFYPGGTAEKIGALGLNPSQTPKG